MMENDMTAGLPSGMLSLYLLRSREEQLEEVIEINIELGTSFFKVILSFKMQFHKPSNKVAV